MIRSTSLAAVAALALVLTACATQESRDTVTPGSETAAAGATAAPPADATHPATGAAPATPATSTTATAPAAPITTGTQTAAAGSSGVRDWAAVDKNHDNLIQPEEMEAELPASARSGPAPNTTPQPQQNAAKPAPKS